MKKLRLASFVFALVLAPRVFAQQPAYPEQAPAPGQPGDATPPGYPPAQPAEPPAGAYPPPSSYPPGSYPPGSYPPPPPPRVYYPPPQPQPGPQVVPFERVLRFGGQTSLMLGFPTGSAFAGTPLGNLASVLIQIEGGPDVILFDRFVLGFNFGIGYVAPGSDLSNSCQADGSASCGGIHLDIGAHAEFRFIQDANYIIVPWVGVEGGYEGFYVFEDYQDGSSSSVSFGGSQFEIRAGADFTRSLERGWGGFLSYRFGRYSSLSTNDTSAVYQTNYTITNEAEHGWFMIGVRGRF